MGFVLMFLAAPVVSVAAVKQLPEDQLCPRPLEGSTIAQPPELRSQNGVLEVTLHFRYQQTLRGEGPPRYCYVTDQGLESPTLRVHPGDVLIIHLRNDLNAALLGASGVATHSSEAHGQAEMNGDCNGGPMSAAVTNLHFHGLNVPPTCHQDDVLGTIVQPGQSFDYRVRIPRDEPPGLYWYHPHAHGFTERQVQGGASGALIVEGIERVRPWLKDLPQRVIVLRDQPLGKYNSADASQPAWDISINYVPVVYPAYRVAQIETGTSGKELWRVVNAGANTLFNLQEIVNGVPQNVQVVAIDGVPTEPGQATQDSVPLAPGARVEFVINTPMPGQQAQLVTTDWDTGIEGDRDPPRPIANIVSRETAPGDATERQPSSRSAKNAGRSNAAVDAPVVQRRLYFSQLSPNPTNPDMAVFYYVTVLGQKPGIYRMGEDPNIVLHHGDVEDWIVENRAQEDHVFHIHQIHFQVLEVDGKPVDSASMRDTIDLPHWTGSGPYPSVKLRLNFSGANAIGVFPYHCHILKHEDMGMMGTVQVLPAGIATRTKLAGPAKPLDVASPATITATIVSARAAQGKPSGTIQFAVDGIAAGRPVQLVRDQASFTTSFEVSGSHTITATYFGDAAHDESISSPLTITVAGSL